MSSFSLEDKFPDLVPIQTAPSLHTVNGIGTGIYGRRDYDEETGTYVTTYCWCVLFIPLFAVAAYRVADAPGGGYYFLGKTRLSGLAKAWNALLAACMIAGLGGGTFCAWHYSPENVALRQLAAAEQSIAAGEHAGAAKEFEKLALGRTKQAAPARERLEKWLAAPPAGAEASDYFEVFKSAAALNQMGRWPAGPQALHDRALTLAELVPAGQSPLAVSLLKAAEPLDENPAASAARKRALLEKLQARAPQDLELTVLLAQALEQEGDFERCEKLLLPLADKLADTEGARILGQRHLSQGKFNEAHALLAPYCKSRMAQYRAAEEAFEAAYKQAQETEINILERNEAFRRRYDAASDEQRQQMVAEKIDEAVKNDPQVAKQRDALRQASRVVPVALDFGVVQLYRAQGLSDPAERKAELQQAETTFLSIGNAIGDTDEYKLNLGKVYYWLGKSKEGRKLLDEILFRAANNFELRMAVAQTLREVGAETDSRNLVEHIYNNATSDDHKYEAAELRALLFFDLDDEIAWLNRARPGDPDVKASLALARGQKGLQDGDEKAAEQNLRQAAELYTSFPESMSSLNDAALCYSGLFHSRGDTADLRQAARLLDRAVSLKPDNSVLMINAADLYFDVALADAFATQIDLRLIHSVGRGGLLGFFYRDGAGRDEVIARLKTSPALAKATQYFDKSILLAPKRGSNYDQASALYTLLDDNAALERILRQIDDAHPDTQETVTETLKYLAGDYDKKTAQTVATAQAASRKLVDHWRAAPAGDKRNRSLAAAQMAAWGALMAKSASPADSPPDAEELLKLAEEALRTHECSMTEQTLISSLLYRVHAQNVAKSPAYRQFAQKYRRHLTPYETLLLALDQKPLAPAILAHADFKRAVELSKQRLARFPRAVAADDWMMLRYADPAAAEQIARRLGDGTLEGRESQIDLRLHPASSHFAVLESWRLQSTGRAGEATAVFQKLNKQGVRWPQP